MSEYEKQATEFLDSIGATFKAQFLRSAPMFDDDKDARDIYAVELTRDGRQPFATEFGQSLAHSREWIKKACNCRMKYGESTVHVAKCPARSKPEAPTAYDVLACLTKSDPGTFEDFCGDMGCDTDSRKALALYLRVQEEWSKVRVFFNADEFDRLWEIA